MRRTLKEERVKATKQKKRPKDVLKHPINISGLYELFGFNYNDQKWRRLAQGPKETMLWGVKFCLGTIVELAGMPSSLEEFLAQYASYLVLSPDNEIVPIKWHEIEPIEGIPSDPNFEKLLEKLGNVIPTDAQITYEGRL